MSSLSHEGDDKGDGLPHQAAPAVTRGRSTINCQSRAFLLGKSSTKQLDNIADSGDTVKCIPIQSESYCDCIGSGPIDTVESDLPTQ